MLNGIEEVMTSKMTISKDDVIGTLQSVEANIPATMEVLGMFSNPRTIVHHIADMQRITHNLCQDVIEVTKYPGLVARNGMDASTLGDFAKGMEGVRKKIDPKDFGTERNTLTAVEKGDPATIDLVLNTYVATVEAFSEGIGMLLDTTKMFLEKSPVAIVVPLIAALKAVMAGASDFPEAKKTLESHGLSMATVAVFGKTCKQSIDHERAAMREIVTKMGDGAIDPETALGGISPHIENIIASSRQAMVAGPAAGGYTMSLKSIGDSIGALDNFFHDQLPASKK
jgi:hypothetical protein